MVEITVPPIPDYIANEYPFPRRMQKLGWGQMHYADTGGQGQTVLMIHGNPTWSFLYRKIMTALVGKPLRLVAPDLIGLGLSDKPRNLADHTVKRHGEAMLEFVQALDLKNVILVVQDWGGPIGTWMAAHAPERIAALLILNTSILAPNRFKTTPFHRFSQMPIVSDFIFRGLNFPVPMLNFAQGDKSSITPAARAAYVWPLRKVLDRAAPLGMARMVPNRADHPTVAELRKTEAWARGFKGPTEIVWGARDPILGRLLNRHREAFPHARVTETQGGHFLQEEVPGVISGAVCRLAGLSVE